MDEDPLFEVGAAWSMSLGDGPVEHPDEQAGGGSIRLYLPFGLAAWLATAQAGPAGTMTPTMTLWLDARTFRWHGVLHSRALEISLFRSGADLPQLLLGLADALHQEPAGWKRDRKAT